MKNTRKRAVSLVMTTAMLLTTLLPTACASRDAKDTELIEDTVEQFIDAFGSGDTDTLENIVDDDFSYEIDTRPYSDILIKLASKTEIDEFESVSIDRNKNTAKVKVSLSVIDIYEFVDDLGGDYHKEDEYLDAIDDYKGRKDENLTFSLSYDKGENAWIIKKASAEKYRQLFDHASALPIANVTLEDVFNICLDIIAGFSEGNFSQAYYTMDMSEIRVFDDNLFQEPILIEGVNEFATAYFKYIIDHGVTAEQGQQDDNLYIVDISGKAPSTDEILDYLTSDEHIIEMYMTTIRISSGTSAMTDNELWSSMYAEIYFDLAKKIPDMKSEEYKRSFYIDPTTEVPLVTIKGTPLNVTAEDVEELGDIPEDQDIRCQKKAIENLYYAGELTKEQYDAYIAELNGKATSGQVDRPSSTDGEFVRNVEWGHIKEYKNWAEDVHEFIPEDYTGNLIFGISEPDPYKTYMIYGKNPEYIDTFGYCYFNKDFIFMIKLPKPLNAGDRMYYTTVENGIENNNIRTIVYQEEYDGEFVIRFPDLKFADNGSYEFRLWADKDATVLMGYVEVIQT